MGLLSSLSSACRPRVPFTPLSSAISQRRHQDVVCATAATSLAVLCERECSMSSWKSLLIKFDLFSVTMDEALLGSLRHLVRTLVPREDSSIRHCCMIEMPYTSTEANDTNISLLISSPLLELDNKWQRKFSLRISTLVDIDGHWRASLTVFRRSVLAVGEFSGQFRFETVRDW